MRAARFGLVLGLLAVVGYLLGGCDTGNGLPGFSGEAPSGVLTVPTIPEVTLPDVTVPEITVPEVTVPTLPTRPETTEPEETTTRPPPTTTRPPVTTVATTTVAETLTVASPPVTEPTTITETNASATGTTGATSSDDGTPWGWILLALGLLGAAIAVAVVAWRRQRGGGPSP